MTITYYVIPVITYYYCNYYYYYYITTIIAIILFTYFLTRATGGKRFFLKGNKRKLDTQFFISHNPTHERDVYIEIMWDLTSNIETP